MQIERDPWWRAPFIIPGRNRDNSYKGLTNPAGESPIARKFTNPSRIRLALWVAEAQLCKTAPSAQTQSYRFHTCYTRNLFADELARQPERFTSALPACGSLLQEAAGIASGVTPAALPLGGA